MASIVCLADERDALHEAAKTINLAFSKDFLINWLRPGAKPWGTLAPDVMKWQKRRLQTAIHNGVVLSIKSSQALKPLSHPNDKSTRSSVVECGDSVDYGAVVMLEPPPKTFSQRTLSQNIMSIWSFLRLWILDRIDPCEDLETKQERWQQMMREHDQIVTDMKAKFLPRRLWYLEVIAVRPSLHGQGLGGRLMKEVIDLAGNDPIMLECTDVSNVKFYQKYGFESVATTYLRDRGPDGEDETVSWLVMVRR